MDKGLIKLNELYSKRDDIIKEMEENDNTIRELQESKWTLNRLVHDIERNMDNLKSERTKAKMAPKKLKYLKVKKVLSSTLLAILVALTILNIINLNISNFILGIISTGIPLTFFYAIHEEYISIKKSVKRTVEEIEIEIGEKREEFANTLDKKEENDIEIRKLEDDNNNLNVDKSTILKEITKIESLRSSVIQKYCENKPELNELLNSAYDDSIEKEEGYQKSIKFKPNK